MDLRNGALVVVALDPGGHTGMAKFTCNYFDGPTTPEIIGREWTRNQLGPHDHHRALYRALELWRTHNYVVICEPFRDRPNKSHVELISAEYVGVVKLFAQNEKVPVVWQDASLVNGKDHFWTDAKLKKVGLYKGAGSEHERDATKHLLHWLTFGPLNDQYYLEILRG